MECSARCCGLRAVDQNGSCQERGCGQALHAQLAGRADPHHPKLSSVASHLQVKHFADADAPNQALYYQSAGTQIRDQRGIGEGLAISIHSPDLHWELNFNAGIMAAIHVSHSEAQVAVGKLTRVTAGKGTGVPEQEL